MAAVLAAVLIGVLVGLVVRPLLDAYLACKTARFYAEYLPPARETWCVDEHRSDVA